MMRTILAAVLAADVAVAADTASRLTQGKLDGDMGRHAAAEAAFLAVADDRAATPSQRWEALIRLGLVRRETGDKSGANQAFERATREHGKDKEVMGHLVRALTGCAPAGPYWDASWDKVALNFDAAGPRLEWPGIEPGQRDYKGETVSVQIKDGDLSDVFRMFADVSRMNVVVWPGVGGKATFDARAVPWEQAMHRLLAPQGLDYRIHGRVLTIGRPDQIGTARLGAAPGTSSRYTGAAVNVDYKEAPLATALTVLAETGGGKAAFDPRVEGRLTIKLVDVPWDQAFDVIVGTHGLAWTRETDTFTVVPRRGAAAGAVARPLHPLRDLSADNARLTAILQVKGSDFVAVLEGPGPLTYVGKRGDRLQGASIAALDATGVTLRHHDGREQRLELYGDRTASGQRRRGC